MNFILNEQKIATLGGCPGNIYLWAVDKRAFCQDKFDFVLSFIDHKNGLMTFENQECRGDVILKQFGVPKKTVDVGNVRLYIYDDITGVVESTRLCSEVSKK
jgi:hypothetical protein